MILGIDFETCSAADIKVGAHAYSLHPSTDVHCAVLGFSERPGHLDLIRWTPGAQLPVRAVQHLRAGLPLLAHNATFEQSIFANVMTRYRWPVPPLAAWHDTAASAAALALPTSLEGLGKALGVTVEKDMEGNALMRSLAKVTVEGGVYFAPVPSPEQMERLLAYCETDVRSMFECWWRLPPTGEQRLREVDARVNARGAYIDRTMVNAMRRIAARRREELDARVHELTGGELMAVPAPPALKRWLADGAIELPSTVRVKAGAKTTTATVDRGAIDELLQREGLTETEREVLRARAEAGRAASLAKLDRVVEMVRGDGRLRHALRYCGAHTGRWTSSGMQVHNLPKGSKELRGEMEQLRQLVLADDYDALRAATPNVLQALSSMLRSTIAAAPGKDLIGGDFSAIEARVLAWLAGQQDVLDVFASGRDIYVEDAAKIGSSDRQLGKVQRLALGYGMGEVKFATTALTYGVVLPLKRAREVKLLWRENNPAITELWYSLEAACHEATTAQRGSYPVGSFLTVHGGKRCLRIELPSGRCLHYWRPHLRTSMRRVETTNEKGELIERELTLTELRYYSEAGDRKSMQLDWTYGGKLVENVTQAVARDLLAEALIRFDGTPYEVVLHVHDSIAAEVPEGTGSVEEFEGLMAQRPTWAAGLPLAVEGYRSKFFKG